MLILVVLIALTMAMQSCEQTGEVTPTCTILAGVGEKSSHETMLYILDTNGDVLLFAGFIYSVRHLDDLRTDLPFRDADGRRVRACTAHHLIFLTEGMAPADYGFAVAAATPLGPDRADRSFLAALVHRGLDSPYYATREAAQSILVRRGPEAIPALLGGLASRDPEIRLRSEWALYEIRTGPL